MQRAVLVLCLLAGCGETISAGYIIVCAPENLPDDARFNGDVIFDEDGVVTAIDPGTTDCERSLIVEDSEGASWTFGFTVVDDSDQDATASLDLEVGSSVLVGYRDRMVWGNVSGLVISDADGLVAAVEQGYWGGALQEVTLDGLSVRRGEEVQATEVTDCEVRESFEIIFEADDTVALTPFATAPLQLGGVELTAVSVSSLVKGSGARCSISDTTDTLTWAVVR